MRQSGRRRGAELEETILTAAWEELAAVGYARLSMEGVAARAHTGKQVLYRRWRNRAELVIAAMRHRTGSIADQIPDTGELRTDVLAVLRWMTQRRQDFGADTIHGIMAELPEIDPEFHVDMHQVMTKILTKAKTRGELTTTNLPARIITLPTDLLRHQLLLTKTPIEETTLTEITDKIFLPLLKTKTPPNQ
jgi:AcrR family transcriptional regulator